MKMVNTKNFGQISLALTGYTQREEEKKNLVAVFTLHFSNSWLNLDGGWSRTPGCITCCSF